MRAVSSAERRPSIQPGAGDPPSWLGLSAEPLPIDAAAAWVVEPGCGAVVSFVGTVRDHADGLEGVTHLEYEAYEEQAVPKLAEIEAELRARWPDAGRVVLLHRVGRVELTEAAVVVVVAAPHRDTAFSAARFAIDTLKASVPIWKREHAPVGARWGVGATPVEPVAGGDR